MEDIKCKECQCGTLSVNKVCRFYWKIQCSHCGFQKQLTYAQLLGYLKKITYGI